MIRRGAVLWSALCTLPVLVLALLRLDTLPDPTWAGPVFHFYVVTFTALLAIGLAVLMRVAAAQLRDARVLILSLSFLSIAGIFLTHALTTPGVLVGDNPWVGFSARLSLLSGAALLATAAITWQPGIRARIVARQSLLTGLCVAFLIGYAVVALVSSAQLSSSEAAEYAGMHDMPMGQATTNTTVSSGGYGADYGAARPPAAAAPATPAATDLPWIYAQLNAPVLSWGLGGLTILLLALAALRFHRIYRRGPSPLAAGFLASGILLAQSQLAMLVGRPWHASWWEYHVLMLTAFAAAVAGLAREYAQTRSVSAIVGSLLLHDTVAQLEQGYTDVIVALVEAVEAKDPYTRGHTQRVAELSVLIGQQLGLADDRLRILNQSAMLHDIGKIGIPDSILHKPGPLDAHEFAVIQEHPLRGYRIIAQVRSLQAELDGVRSHHERLDGSGYPDGLRGSEIPLDARIIAVADVFDALTSERPYRAAWPVARALAIIDAEAGTKLDPDCVGALHAVLPVWHRATTLSSAASAALVPA